MAAPTLIASYSADYTSAGTSKTVSVTCSAGDTLVIYATGDKNALLGPATASGVNFATIIRQNGDSTYGAIAYTYALQVSALANLTISMTESTGTSIWGFTCLVVRNCYGVFGTSTTSTTGTPSINLFANYNNSAALFVIVDSSAQSGTNRVWRSINGTTPTNANGLELTYQNVAGVYTTYAALYPDTGVQQQFNTYGLSAPGGQTYRLFTPIELVGPMTPIFQNIALNSYSTSTSRTTNINFTVNDVNTLAIGIAYVGVRPTNGTDSTVTTTMTLSGKPMKSVAKIHSNNGTQGYIEVFTMTNVSGTSNPVVATANATVDLRLQVYAIKNVDQGNPISNLQTNYGLSTNGSLTFTNTFRSIIFAAMVSGMNITSVSSGSSGNVITSSSENFNNSSDGGCAAAQIIVIPSPTSQTAGWTITSGPWAVIGFTINSTSYFPPGVIYGLGM